MPEHQTYAAASVALPIADRRRAHDFYAAALGLEPVGPIASDGLPEPLMFVVNGHLRLVLIPTGASIRPRGAGSSPSRASPSACCGSGRSPTTPSARWWTVRGPRAPTW